METKHLDKMISTRIEVDNIAAMDKVSRAQGISRSDWIRRALLAQLVLDLVALKQDVARETPAARPGAPRRSTFRRSPRSSSTWSAPTTLECIKSIDHEGDCLD